MGGLFFFKMNREQEFKSSNKGLEHASWSVIHTEKASVEKGSVLQGKLIVNQDKEEEGEIHKESDDKRECVMEWRSIEQRGITFWWACAEG